GLLAWLVTGSLRGRFSPRRLPGAAWALVMVVAIGDEAIQWALPNRHGLLLDVSLDGGSAALALAAMGLLGIFKERSAGARG
ncbi:MAG: VanZ family protein, partial [SAR324 cluster bacterium]|nr:VanZ family protein [SAR324 cluster bacterium]